MTNLTEEGKKTSKTKKFFKTLGLSALAVLAGVAIYDHRQQISSGVKNAVSWAKKTLDKRVVKKS